MKKQSKIKKKAKAKQKTKQKKKAAVLFSGGKDSCLALWKASKKYEICCLLSMIPVEKDSLMFHKPNLKLLKEQAKQLDLPLILQKTSGKENRELNDLKKLIAKVKNCVDVLAVGGLASNYQDSRIRKIASAAGLKVYAPIWKYAAEKLWHEMLGNGFKVIITKISCEGLSPEFIGKIINAERYKKLELLSKKYKFRLDFEGGEAETSVIDMPLFKKQIKIKGDVISEDKYRHFLKLK